MTDLLLGPATLALLRRALDGYTVDTVQELLGPVGRAAHARGDLSGVAHALPDTDPLATLVRLFLLGRAVPEVQARTALLPLDLGATGPLLEVADGAVRARLEIRPYGTDTDGPWWVVSDFGSDVRNGPLQPDHVLGIGGASVTLAQATPRRPVGRALDIGTGCGVQALHAATHAATVVATDVSDRALRLASTTAWLSGQEWDLRRGSLLEPVAGEQFDLVVANPPFVVSPGFDRARDGFDYRDSGLSGDAASATLVRAAGGVLAPDGSASLLANWIIPADGDWTGRVERWVDGTGCDAWVWQREVVEPGEYVTMWLRDAGEVPGSARWTARYDEWLDWFGTERVAAVGMGLVTMWRTDSAAPSIVCEDVPQAVEQPVGVHLPHWLARQRWLARTDDATLVDARLRHAPDLVLTRHAALGADGWTDGVSSLRQPRGMRWEIEIDDAMAGLVAACDGEVPLGVLLDVLAAVSGVTTDEIAAAALPVVRDLIGRGLFELAQDPRVAQP